jgi:hypothetical protein
MARSPKKGVVHFCGPKGGGCELGRCLAADWGQMRVLGRVNCLCISTIGQQGATVHQESVGFQ